MEGLTPGRIVHYVYCDDEMGVLGHNAGEHRAAMVVNAHAGYEEGIVNLLVFPDGFNDLTEIGEGAQHGHTPAIWRISVCHGPEGTPGTWHWIERA